MAQIPFRLSKLRELIERNVYFASLYPCEDSPSLRQQADGPFVLVGRALFGHGRRLSSTHRMKHRTVRRAEKLIAAAAR